MRPLARCMGVRGAAAKNPRDPMVQLSSIFPPASMSNNASTKRLRKWTPANIYTLLLILGACLLVMLNLPRSALWTGPGELVAVLGAIGAWRYSWWLTHFVRAKIYQHQIYPELAAAAGDAWERGWRPARVHVLMTTYREPRATAEAVVASICAEVRAIGQPATIWIGSREAPDEATLIRHFKLVGSDLDLQIRVIRQTQPGKRVAIALLLRAMAREGLGSEDIVAFMDGDFVLLPGALSRSLALFATDPQLACRHDRRGRRRARPPLDAELAQPAVRAAPLDHAVARRLGPRLDLDGAVLGVPGDPHHDRGVHPAARGRSSQSLAVGDVPLPFGRRQEHLVRAPAEERADAVCARRLRLHHRAYRRPRHRPYVGEPAALVRQHAAQRRPRHRFRTAPHAVLHLVVPRRPAVGDVDDAVRPTVWRWWRRSRSAGASWRLTRSMSC